MDATTTDLINSPLALILPADAYRDRAYLEWLISTKEADNTTDNDF
jgi:hypothetical protein